MRKYHMERLSNGFREGRWSLPFLFACTLSHFSCVQVFATLWTVAQQPPLSMGFSRQEFWSGLPFPSPGDLPDPGMEPASLPPPALAGGFLPLALCGKPSVVPGAHASLLDNDNHNLRIIGQLDGMSFSA